jgi:hypothetical protein
LVISLPFARCQGINLAASVSDSLKRRIHDASIGKNFAIEILPYRHILDADIDD